MFSTVLGMLRPSEKLKSHEKVDFGKLLKHCNLNCFGDFGTLSGRHNFAENWIFALSDGKLKNLQRRSKTNDFGTFRYRFWFKKVPIWSPEKYLFEVQKWQNLRFTGRQNIAKTLDVMQKQWFWQFQVPFWSDRAAGRKSRKRYACACFSVSETIANWADIALSLRLCMICGGGLRGTRETAAAKAAQSLRLCMNARSKSSSDLISPCRIPSRNSYIDIYIYI